ncbi:MAG: YvcK family protein [Gloeocapsa sp. DLM2.Bin57]|nr:MAG: YvcK family protein [Gloeocapsa sp. DLM2.Bin57]
MDNLSQKKSVKKANQWLKWYQWLSPGLFVKRWLLITISGVLLAGFGIAIWSNLTPVYRIMALVSGLLEVITEIMPSYVSGPLVIIAGLFLIFWGQSSTVNTITRVLKPENDEQILDLLMNHRRLNRGPKIVTIGGGTGLSNLLRGLKEYSANITAIVTVADDGGSSGRLRREIGVLPPGDIRNCLAALADEEKLLTELFQYRFNAGDGLIGHSFGNLFLTAMSDITGDLEKAIAASSRVLAVRGKVLPSTLTDVNLWVKLTDGRIIEGESSIAKARGKIETIGCHPTEAIALPAAVKAIQEADYLIIGPGSLYTSIIPNLLVPDIVKAIAESQAPSIYICNIMTEPGETDEYSVSDHIRAIDKVTKGKIFDAVLVNRTLPSDAALERYATENSHPVILDREAIAKLGRGIVLANIMEEETIEGYIRHNSQLLAQVLLRWYHQVSK